MQITANCILIELLFCSRLPLFVVSAGGNMAVFSPSSQYRGIYIFRETLNVTDVVAQIDGLRYWLPTWTLLLLGCGCLLFLFVAGLLANITVCTVMAKRHCIKKHISNFMLFHLSITDMLYRLVVFPALWIIMLFLLQSKPAWLCKGSKTLLSTVHTAVFTSLVMIAVDMHQKITKPFSRVGHNPKFYLYVLAIWGYSFVTATPQIYIEEVAELHFTIPLEGVNTTFLWQYCYPSRGISQQWLAICRFVLGFVIPLLVITLAHSKIAIYLRRKSRQGRTNQAALKSKGKALRMLVLMVLGFVVCLGIPQVNSLLYSFNSRVLILDYFGVVLHLSTSLVNPILYGIYSAEFKQGLRNWKMS